MCGTVVIGIATVMGSMRLFICISGTTGIITLAILAIMGTVMASVMVDTMATTESEKPALDILPTCPWMSGAAQRRLVQLCSSLASAWAAAAFAGSVVTAAR